jgi:transposase
MNKYEHFVGCDISKDKIDIYDDKSRKSSVILNSKKEIVKHLTAYHGLETFFIFEATGIYGRSLHHALSEAGMAYNCVNPLWAKRFSEARGRLVKNDRLDAKMLALMGQSHALEAQVAPDLTLEELKELVLRRDQLVEIRKMELQHRHSLCEKSAIAKDIKAHICQLDKHIAAFEAKITTYIENEARLKEKRQRLESCPGIGKVGSSVLLAHIPELGTLNAEKIAALVGLCPYTNESGTFKGQRRIRGGRTRVRTALYQSAVSCIKTKTPFADFYKRLRKNGKSAKVALVAVARKIVITLNAMLKNGNDYVNPNKTMAMTGTNTAF